MNAIVTIVKEALGLFVDDGTLALSTLVVFGAAVVVALVLGAPSAITGTVLLTGCVGVLCENVLRYGRRRRP